MLKRFHETRRNENGFTLVELMVVITVVGCLMAVAMILMGNYVSAAIKEQMRTDTLGTAKAMETYFAKNPALSSFDFNEAKKLGKKSDNVTLSFAGTPQDYCLIATQGNYSQDIDSETGLPENHYDYLIFRNLDGTLQQISDTDPKGMACSNGAKFTTWM